LRAHLRPASGLERLGRLAGSAGGEPRRGSAATVGHAERRGGGSAGRRARGAAAVSSAGHSRRLAERGPSFPDQLHNPERRGGCAEGDAGRMGDAGRERAMTETATALPERAVTEALAAIRFNADGLVAAIAQQHDSGEVLMMAWMNRDAVAETLRTGRVCYWSRSRQALWRKGETSGQMQVLKRFLIDCDGD